MEVKGERNDLWAGRATQAEGTENQVLRRESPWAFEEQQEGRVAGKQ